MVDKCSKSSWGRNRRLRVSTFVREGFDSRLLQIRLGSGRDEPLLPLFADLGFLHPFAEDSMHRNVLQT